MLQKEQGIFRAANLRIRALLVDDEEIILDVTSRFLKRSGRISATCCNSGDQAFELLKTEKFEIIISDYQETGALIQFFPGPSHSPDEI